MKRNGSHLRQYLPWLGLLLGVDALAALLLWLADARAFAAMTAVIVLATVFLFAGVCAVLCARSKRREQAFTAFLTTPDAAHEQALCRLLSPAESRSAHLLGETLMAAWRDGYRALQWLNGRLRKPSLGSEPRALKRRLGTAALGIDGGASLRRRRRRLQCIYRATGCRRSSTRCSTTLVCGAALPLSGCRCAAASTRCSTTTRCWRRSQSSKPACGRTVFSDHHGLCTSCWRKRASGRDPACGRDHHRPARRCWAAREHSVKYKRCADRFRSRNTAETVSLSVITAGRVRMRPAVCI